MLSDPGAETRLSIQVRPAGSTTAWGDVVAETGVGPSGRVV
jgi:hypothetical protein